MKREYYSDSIANFLKTSPEEIIGKLTMRSDFAVEHDQRDAWLMQTNILQKVLSKYNGAIYFEYSIPRMGKRIDVVLAIGPVIFVVEFKVGAKEFSLQAQDQVFDYALDLKNFHETSHSHYIAPLLVATKAKDLVSEIVLTPQNDNLFFPIKCSVNLMEQVIDSVLALAEGDCIDVSAWGQGRYCPTPTIVEAAMALYKGHNVEDISRSDANAINLSTTSDSISEIIYKSKENGSKSICFVTGVPGAGKTLVGLNIATKHIDKKNDLYSVFLSGNGPLVAVLREALARDKVEHGKNNGNRIKKGDAKREVSAFIQNVHHFRDDCLVEEESAPVEHVALFDEAQRAWDLQQTSNFMSRKKNRSNFNISESEFLISCLDRHKDWAVIVCLVGGGQEINTGEAGIKEWIESLERSFKDWHVYISSRLEDEEYAAKDILEQLKPRPNVFYKDELHLGVSMRSFRAESVSLLVKQMLDLDKEKAKDTLEKVVDKYPIGLTRNLSAAKKWLKQQARGSERYGLVVSSQAERLKPHAIDVKRPVNPIHWFLADKKDVRSSYYLEDVATEFHSQGLELDWVCVTWDADLRYSTDGWKFRSFKGSKWQNIKKEERQKYLINAYRVLLTRARQGMVIVVPEGESTDPTRKPEFYDPTFEYLKSIGFRII